MNQFVQSVRSKWLDDDPLRGHVDRFHQDADRCTAFASTITPPTGVTRKCNFTFILSYNFGNKRNTQHDDGGCKQMALHVLPRRRQNKMEAQSGRNYQLFSSSSYLHGWLMLDLHNDHLRRDVAVTTQPLNLREILFAVPSGEHIQRVIPRQKNYFLRGSSHGFPSNFFKKIVPYLSDFLAKGKFFLIIREFLKNIRK